MKQCFFLLLLMTGTVTIQAQLPQLQKNSPSPILQKVITGLSNGFSGIKGELIGSSTQSNEYQSLLCWAGAEKCFVTVYSPLEDGKNKTVGNYSWQAFMPSMESFKETTKQYKQIYHQINNNKVLYNGQSITLKADYVAPSEEVGFHTILFESKEARRLQVEVQIANVGMEWQVKLAVFEIEQKEQE